MESKYSCTAIVLAAGQGRRMGTDLPKQFLPLCGKPVLWYSLNCFQNSGLTDRIVLVTGKEWIGYCEEEIVQKYGLSKVKTITEGGENRYDSVYNGLKACADTEFVMIHDGARPFITDEILSRGLLGAEKTGACVIGMPSKDTVKIADQEGFIKETPQRSSVWIIQTPQVFRYSLIREAYRRIMESGTVNVTDDAMVVEQTLGTKIALAEGSYENLKVTTPDDLLKCRAIVEGTKSFR